VAPDERDNAGCTVVGTILDSVLFAALVISAALVFGYRVYRLTKGGPVADVWGGAVLAILLLVLGVLVAADVGWARWPALAYGLLFALVVMPIWVLGVLLPLDPGATDYLFTGLYWASLVLIVVAAL
jgi:hypothetical protein